jgi:membrane-associated HD superfamily phosphohydrolase
MKTRLVDAILLVVGAAVIVNGFVGSRLYNDADMAITKVELKDMKSPSKITRAVYILAGVVMFVYGFLNILR